MTISYDFHGRTAVVSGASKGIGRRVAERLRDAGARVWAWDMSPAQDEGISSVRVDVRNGQEIAAALQQVLGQNGRVDILVNSAGYLGGYRPFEDHDRADWLPSPDHLEVSSSSTSHALTSSTHRTEARSHLRG